MNFIIISAIIILLFIAAIISATETAITSISPGSVQKFRKGTTEKRANILLSMIKTKDKVISSLLIGNSLANTICTTIAAGLFINIFGDDGTLIASVVMSFMIIVFSEVIPKAIALVKAEQIAIFLAPFMNILLKFLYPINLILGYMLRAFCYIFKINLKKNISGEEEVRGIIAHHLEEGNVVKTDGDMLGGVLDIKKMAVSDVMIHRSNIFSLDINMKQSDLIKQAFDSGYTRIPLWDKNPDDIVGIINMKDLTKKIYISNKNLSFADNSDLNNIDLKSLITKPLFVPETALVAKQMHIFKEGKTHLGCVVDEYGDLQGILTLEDILEEIVGQIYDEHDNNHEKIIVKSKREYIVDGSVTIRDINRELNIDIPEYESPTIAGFIIDKLQTIPQQGTVIKLDKVTIIVLKKKANSIKKIRILL